MNNTFVDPLAIKLRLFIILITIKQHKHFEFLIQIQFANTFPLYYVPMRHSTSHSNKQIIFCIFENHREHVEWRIKRSQ